MIGNDRLALLNGLIDQCRNSNFYANRLKDKAITTMEDLKKLPFTTKEDVRNNSPFNLLCVPRKELYQYHETFGTTGEPCSTWLTKREFLDFARRVNAGGIHFSENDIVLIRFPYAISSVAHFVHAAAQDKGACVIPASSRNTVSPYTRIVKLLRKLDVTVLAALPLQCVLIAETAEMMGFDPKCDFPNLRVIYTAGEVMTPFKRKTIQRIWGVPVNDNYGMTEIGPAIVDCEYGIPHPLEDSFILELLDEGLKNEVGVGETGNLVVTTLTKEAVPLLRYITGDRARRISMECPCGKNDLIQIRGRREDAICVNGRWFDLWDLEEIVSNIDFCRFWVAGPLLDGLKFVMEKQKPEDRISCEQMSNLEKRYGVKLYFEVVPKGTLYERNELSAVANVGKPKYLYTEQEMKEKAYIKSAKV